jgi:ApbE superfamily uncharacterized protein (UPF0280 family)
MKRFYRDSHRGRFKGFNVAVKETDLWVGVRHPELAMEGEVRKFVENLRGELEEYIRENPEFSTSLDPLPFSKGPEVVRKMVEASQKAGVGPMAAVAGAFSQMAGEFLQGEFGCGEVAVENGGDIYLVNEAPVTVSVFAGKSPLSNRVGLKIPPGKWGICTSSATVGHSLSFGKADAVTIVAADAAVADAFATAWCNRVQGPGDLEQVVTQAVKGEVKTALAILGDRMALAGEHELVVLKPKAGETNESH